MRRFVICSAAALAIVGFIISLIVADAAADKPKKKQRPTLDRALNESIAAPVTSVPDPSRQALIDDISEIRRQVGGDIFAGTSLEIRSTDRSKRTSDDDFERAMNDVLQAPIENGNDCKWQSSELDCDAKYARLIAADRSTEGIPSDKGDLTIRPEQRVVSIRAPLDVSPFISALHEAAFGLETQAYAQDLDGQFDKADKLRRLARRLRKEARVEQRK